MKACLTVIDAQASFQHRPFFTPRDMPAYLAAQNALIRGAQAAGLPIVRIFHVDGPQHASNPFATASGHVRPIDGLADFEAAATFQKSRHSALVGTGLGVWLVRNGIQRIVVTGIRTEQCCETTTRHASDLGYAVDFVTDATLTFDMRQPDGQTLGAPDIKTRTATVLQDRFATLCTVDQALERLGACAAEGVESENRPQREPFLPDSQPHGPAMGQKDGEKWAAAGDWQPTLLLPRRLPA